MRDESTLIHCEHVSARTFDQVVAAFESQIGRAGPPSFSTARGRSALRRTRSRTSATFPLGFTSFRGALVKPIFTGWETHWPRKSCAARASATLHAQRLPSTIRAPCRQSPA